MVGLCLMHCSPPVTKNQSQNTWPSVTREMKPWTRWWWHGSSVTREGLTAEMEAYHAAGFGGLEITPIYGVYGEEDQFVEYLSPQWMELLRHVLAEAKRLDMGIDMATGTGWPFGGPWVGSNDACKNLRHKVYELDGGTTLSEKIEFIQQPYLRLVGNQLYEVNENAEKEGRKLSGTRKEPALIMDTKKIKITDLVDPVEKNENLQALAIDQLQFEKPLRLKTLMAYRNNTEPIELTNYVDKNGKLEWIAPPGKWQIYAVFEGFHGKMVERAGPGGEGNVIDHFSELAVHRYLRRFDDALQDQDITSLRAFFNDSYEVDDARGTADFTPDLFTEFKSRRGYDLRHELPALFGRDTNDKNIRVLCDYRETLSELLLDNFTNRWKAWANKKGALVRNQAHGSPANILDLYASVDIPEIEGTEPLRFKMATSSGNVTGKKLISAEAATWLNEHFESNLADVKGAVDKFFLQGVNHIVYHGTCYSAPGDEWPGRLFYAAVHMNPRNPLWNEVDVLNRYVERCQSFLQTSVPDNDVLLYFPIYDRFSSRGPEMVEHFDGISKSLEGSGFAVTAQQLLNQGYSFDYISDKQLSETNFEKGLLQTSGNSFYKTLIIPPCQYMPLTTLKKIVMLAEAGASIVFLEKTPGSPSGFKNYEGNKTDLNAIVKRLNSMASAEQATVQIGKDLSAALLKSGVKRETMFDIGIQTIRKKTNNGDHLYFLSNTQTIPFEGWLPFRDALDYVVLYDPMTGKSGEGVRRKAGSGTEVFIRLEPSQSLILQSRTDQRGLTRFPYYSRQGKGITLSGSWRVSFESGGPVLPQTFESDSLLYWTNQSHDSYTNFSGRAVYETSFQKPPGKTDRWLLTLDSLKETAEIFLNGESIGALIGPPYQVEVNAALLKPENVLQIKVSNLMANRIAYLDRNNISWKKFYNVNFPARKRENLKNNLFNASHWKTKPSGISGTCELHPVVQMPMD